MVRRDVDPGLRHRVEHAVGVVEATVLQAQHALGNLRERERLIYLAIQKNLVKGCVSMSAFYVQALFLYYTVYSLHYLTTALFCTDILHELKTSYEIMFLDEWLNQLLGLRGWSRTELTVEGYLVNIVG